MNSRCKNTSILFDTNLIVALAYEIINCNETLHGGELLTFS